MLLRKLNESATPHGCPQVHLYLNLVDENYSTGKLRHEDYCGPTKLLSFQSIDRLQYGIILVFRAP